jgi:hypothetical protein
MHTPHCASNTEVHAELRRRYLARPSGPVTAIDRAELAQRAARDRAERERNEKDQTELNF